MKQFLTSYIRKFLKDEKGNALIETAVAIPLLMGIFMGVVMFTNGFRYNIIMNMAVQEGAREYQVSMGNTEKAIGKTYEELGLGFVEGVSVSSSGGRIKAEKPYAFYLPFINEYVLNIRAEHTFMEEIAEREYGQDWEPE